MVDRSFDADATRWVGKRLGLMGGDLVEDKYGIERELGRGSIGIVYSAWHVGLDRRVVLKVLRPELVSDVDATRRFQEEAKAAAALSSEAAVKVFDVGCLPSGAPYVVMEHLDGDDLATIVAATGPLEPTHAIDLVLAACEAVDEAHRQGILHRAIEPKNLVVPRDTTATLVKVTDFGVAKAARVSTTRERRTIVTTASPFNAPEHFAGGDVDVRTDIWSLGATLHYLVAARAPFDGGRAFQVCAKILSQDPPRLRAHRPDAPEPLERLIAKCMRRDPRARFESVRDLGRALRDVKRELAQLPKSERVPPVEQRETLRLPTRPIPSARRSSSIVPVLALPRTTSIDPDTSNRTAMTLAWLCGVVVFVAVMTAWSVGTHLLQTSKHVAVTTSTSPSLFARR